MDGLRRALVGWIAVLALLVQVAVPDLAMAARARAGLPAGVLTALAESDHCRPAEDGGPPAGVHRADGPGRPGGDSPGHEGADHGALCAFCLALGTHGLSPGSVVVPPRPVVHAAAPAAAERSVRPIDQFLTCLNPRAPPA
ncbi:hypothetical protein TSO352_09380 [Azospirillum sp. TSO35-2]|nr:hypothetical protein TSO352_09380 [Azospirillum sp. TSO35-2]